MRKILMSVLTTIVILLLFTTSAFAEKSQGTVSADALNVRSYPEIASNVIGTLYNGQVVDILGTEGEWYKINYNSFPSYVHSDYIVLKSIEYASENNTSITIGNEIVEYAKTFIGTPYVYGGTSPSGFDCSGFVYYIYKNFGVTLNRVANDQSKNGYIVEKSDLQPGDIVLFSRTLDGYITHVGIYVGDGKFIHSPQTGKTVEIVSMSNGYYNYGYVGARRIFV